MPPAMRTTVTIAVTQALLTALCAAVFAWHVGAFGARSSAVGGAIAIITTLFFALRVFGGGAGRTASQMARAFYMGEFQKILLTVALFMAVIRWLEVAYLPLFVAYIACLLAFWIVIPFSLTSGVATAGTDTTRPDRR